MKLIVPLVIFLIVHHGISQNEAYRCQKTTWDNSSKIQIDTYNSENQLLGFIRIDKDGDTTQWHKNEYNQQGLISANIILIDQINFKRANFQYDSLGKLVYTEVIGFHTIDTLWEDQSIVYDEHGNPLNYPKWKYPKIDSIGYKYDESGLMLEVKYFDETQTVTSHVVFEYDKNSNLIKQLNYENGELTKVSNMSYNQSGQRTVLKVVAHDGKLIRSEKNKYDKNGNMIQTKIFHVLNADPVTMTYKTISCQ